jgi:hypothetical protein
MIQTIEIAEAIHPLSEYARHADIEPILITVDGKPTVMVIAVEGIDLESVSLSHSPEFLAIIERSRKSQNTGKGFSSDEMRAFLGVKSEEADKGFCSRKK